MNQFTNLVLFVVAVGLIILLIPQRKELRPDPVHYEMLASSHIYFDRQNKDTIFCTLKKSKDSYIYFRCKDNNKIYYYSIDNK